MHAFALGMCVFLFVLIFARLFASHKHPYFNKFFIIYHAGVGISTATMLATVFTSNWVMPLSQPFPELRAWGHIVLTICFCLFFYVLISSITEFEKNVSFYQGYLTPRVE